MQLAHCLVFQPCDSAGGLIFILIILYRYLFHFSPESYPFMFLSLSDLDKLIAFVKLTICSSPTSQKLQSASLGRWGQPQNRFCLATLGFSWFELPADITPLHSSTTESCPWCWLLSLPSPGLLLLWCELPWPYPHLLVKCFFLPQRGCVCFHIPWQP